MKALGTKLALQAALLLLLSSAAVPLRAQERQHSASLEVCNKGTVPVEVVAAMKNNSLTGLLGLSWDVLGTTVAAGKCETVWTDYLTGADAAYIGFGFANATGQWGSGTIAQVPDFGIYYQWLRSHKILSSATHAMCAQKDATGYRSDGDIPVNCAELKYGRSLYRRSNYAGRQVRATSPSHVRAVFRPRDGLRRRQQLSAVRFFLSEHLAQRHQPGTERKAGDAKRRGRSEGQ